MDLNDSGLSTKLCNEKDLSLIATGNEWKRSWTILFAATANFMERLFRYAQHWKKHWKTDVAIS